MQPVLVSILNKCTFSGHYQTINDVFELLEEPKERQLYVYYVVTIVEHKI